MINITKSKAMKFHELTSSSSLELELRLLCKSGSLLTSLFDSESEVVLGGKLVGGWVEVGG